MLNMKNFRNIKTTFYENFLPPGETHSNNVCSRLCRRKRLVIPGSPIQKNINKRGNCCSVSFFFQYSQRLPSTTHCSSPYKRFFCYILLVNFVSNGNLFRYRKRIISMLKLNRTWYVATFMLIFSDAIVEVLDCVEKHLNALITGWMNYWKTVKKNKAVSTKQGYFFTYSNIILPLTYKFYRI